jgi:hypothetical protein
MANTERDSRVRCVTGSATKAEYNAGKIIVQPDSSRSIIVVGGWLRSTGSVTQADSININDTTGTSVVNVAVAAANLTNGALAPFSAATGVTLTTFGAANTKGKGLQILSVGADETTATVCDYCVEYMTV